MEISKRGVGMVARFEGKRLTAYVDAVGVLTIGYGHTSRAGLPYVTPGMTITDQQALDILQADLAKFCAAVNRVVQRTPNQNQFDAMVSLCYNIGPAAFGHSTVLADFNKGDNLGAAQAFLMWVKAGDKTLPGLVARRHDEKALFESPVEPPATTQPPPAKPSVASNAGLAGLFEIIIKIITAIFARKK
jgi:lysozyme